MTEREQLRRKGEEVRRKLGLPDDIGAELLPGMPHLVDEVIFGRVWGRPGLELEDRMLATLVGTHVQTVSAASWFLRARCAEPWYGAAPHSGSHVALRYVFWNAVRAELIDGCQ